MCCELCGFPDAIKQLSCNKSREKNQLGGCYWEDQAFSGADIVRSRVEHTSCPDFLSDSPSTRRPRVATPGYQDTLASPKLATKANVTLERLKATSPVACAQTSSVAERSREGRSLWREREEGDGLGGLSRKQLGSLVQRCGRLLVLSYKMEAFLVQRGGRGD